MDAGKKRTRHNPRKTASPLSVLFFSYTLPLFKEGYSRDLTVDDLFDPLEEDTSAFLGDKLEQQWEKQLKSKKPRLIGAIARTFSFDLLRLLCLTFLNDVVFKILQPLMLGYLLQYFKPPRIMPRGEALMYAAAIVIIIAISTITFNHNMLGSLKTGMRIRSACCSLIYRKSLRMSRTALGETAAGQVVNLLSNDVSRFDLVSVLLIAMCCAPITGCICAYLTYSIMGASAFVGVGVVFVIVPTQAYLSTLTSKYRSQTALKTDKRVRLTDEIISGIQVIKMYAWEKPFTNLIEMARKFELKVIRKTSFIRGIYMSFNLCTTRLALCCSLITFVLVGNDLTADKVFVVLTYFTILAQSMSMIFVRGIAEVAEALVSVRRIEEYLANEEIIETKTKSRVLLNGMDSKEDKEEKGEDVAVQMEGVTAKWVESLSENTLDAVELRVHRGQLVGVAGPVGAGKSSLLQAILGELTVSEGTCKVHGRLSYACQDPWVFAATVRQNILFGLPFDRRRYREVIRACALQRDLDLLPQGDLTVVGERGTSLSGGQKARVNLARAVYRDADIYLLDDPLSAVDTHVGKHLFEECIVKFLQKKTRILVTHQVQNLPHTDHVVVIDGGKIKAQGLYASIVQNPEYAMMLTLSGDNTVKGEPEGRRPSQVLDRQRSTLSRQISQTSTWSVSSYHGSLVEGEEEEEEEAPDMMEATTKGLVKRSPYVGYFRSGANYFVILPIVLLFAFAQILASGCDYFISYWTIQEETRGNAEKMNSFLSNMTRSAVYNETITKNTTSLENQSFNVSEFTTTNNETNYGSLLDGLLETETLVYIYVAITVGLLIIAFTRSLTFYTICIKSSRKLHDTMFTKLMRTTLRFFNTNPSGRILNRFSKDMGAIDEILPKAVLDSSQLIMTVLGALVIAVIINWVYLIPIVVMGVPFWFVRKIYLRSSKNIKRLEGMTKSPVFTHLLATLQGLTTIRAYGAENVVREEFDKHQDLHTSAWYMYLTTSQTFGFTLDAMSNLYIAFITFSFLFLEDLFGGQIGLAITQAMSITGFLQYGIRQSAEVANQMMAVERVMEYLGLEEEPLLEAPPEKKTPNDWPSKGEIEFRHIYMRYGPQTNPVILDLNLRIKHGEKVGVVGRTGAGKSSLISALFRLAFLEGELIIDGLDTAKVGLRDLRARLSIIPQDPVLFAGTLRFNLDPFDEFSDEVLWRTLDEVELRESLHDNLGLQTRVLDQGSNFSVGQRQLVCLARAILRNNRILMLDEATANVDNNTDSLIQKTIRLKFAHCTVLTVAHRLNTIMDSDKVLVMDAGRRVEFDHPHVLLKNQEGFFYKMVEQTGPSMAEQLRRVAEECYNSTIRQ